MIKLIEARYSNNFQIAFVFSDGKEGTFDGTILLKKTGSLLAPLRDESYFSKFFIDAGALCWPNGLEISPSRLYESCRILEAA
jgi:hypothetical protein